MAKQDLPPILVTGKCWVGVRKTNDTAIKLPPIGQSHTDTEVNYFRFNHGRRKYPVAKYSVYPPIKHKVIVMFIEMSHFYVSFLFYRCWRQLTVLSPFSLSLFWFAALFPEFKIPIYSKLFIRHAGMKFGKWDWIVVENIP